MARQRAKRNAGTKDLTITTSDGYVYALPAFWSIKEAGSVTLRNKLTDRGYTHGSTVTGDGKIEGRTIQVEFYLRGATEQEHDAAVNGAYQYFTGTNYSLRAGRGDRLYKVAACSKIKQEFVEGFKQRYSKVTVSLLLADPFRYAIIPTVIKKTYAKEVTADTLSFILESTVDVPLVWTFKPTQTMGDIEVLHLESGQSFRLADALLTTPMLGVVNAEQGTVRRDDSNSINSFSGVFLHAVPGKNTYQITCDAGTVEISYTNRWIT